MKIDIIKLDDWAALYVDGVLKYQNHSIREYDYIELLRSLGAKINIAYFDEEEFDFPLKLEDLDV